jgi:hypothetical protein
MFRIEHRGTDCSTRASANVLNDIGVMFPVTTLDLCRGGGTEAMLSNLLFFDERLICPLSFLLQFGAALTGLAASLLRHLQLQYFAAGLP